LFVRLLLVVRRVLGVLLFLDLGGRRLRIGGSRLLFGVGRGISGHVSSIRCNPDPHNEMNQCSPPGLVERRPRHVGERRDLRAH